jgi:hypothetical protein
VGEAADGSKIDFIFRSNCDGKEGKVERTGMPLGADAVALKRVSARKVTATMKKDGKIVGLSTANVSADGKTTRLTFKAVGGTEEMVSVYDKQ